ARVLLDAARREGGNGHDLDTVAAIVDTASQDLRFNQRVLEAALHNMSQGISVVDAQLRLVAWNRRYAELFGFPDALLRVGTPVAELSAWTLQRMPHKGSLQQALARRLNFMRAGSPHLSERVFFNGDDPDGRIIEIRGNPMPGGGFVATFTDVTAFRRAENELLRANETLEQRVADRTTRLEQAKREAEHANDAKSRFLAAIGHDLLQPLHAAHLFTDALAQQLDAGTDQSTVASSESVMHNTIVHGTLVQIRGALDSTTGLLTGLLDMSRLEAGGLVPERRAVPLAEVLDPLVSEFRALAAERGLAFRHVPSALWVDTDPQLLRRVLQNFLANAVRYTTRGRILLGVRRDGSVHGGSVRIEVHDTGPGIARDQQKLIFEEFRRGGDAPGQGLGLGLAIADRIAELLRAPLSLRSEPGRGTMFGVAVPLAAPQSRDPAVSAPERARLPGLHVLIVDNEPMAMDALRRVLEGWGCRVSAAARGMEAAAAIADDPADAWLFDYHLDDDTGVALHERLVQHHSARPTVILSADHTEAVRRAVHEAGLSLLMKPLKPLALKSVLDRLLAARVVQTT
ncbi:MAG TPA: PAS-domain containing protein, partial [Lysobacter sp.]|nr:PAS-domain containing protein [Lysobacter sp.]